MKRNSVVGAVVVVAAMFAGQAAYARPLAISPTGARAMFKSKGELQDHQWHRCTTDREGRQEQADTRTRLEH